MNSALNKLSKDWNNITELVCFGFGRRAARLLKPISCDFTITRIIDNNPKLRGQFYYEVPIQSFDEVKNSLGKEKIIITTGGNAYLSIKASLESIGLVEYKDFSRYEEFLTEWYWKKQKKVVLSEVYLSITSRCTLQCEKCSLLMPYYNKKTHYLYTKNEIMQTMEAFFQNVDYLMSFFVMGGEPLLHDELVNILEEICNRYANRIGFIQIITNGTIKPKKELVDLIKKNSIELRLSDYTISVPYEKKLKEIQLYLSENDVPYSISRYETWLDIGVPGKEKPLYQSGDEIKRHIQICGPCHMIAEQKFFYCGTIFSAEKCGLAKLNEGDFIDLKEDATEKNKLKLLLYSLGEFENKYVELCNTCYGKSGENKRIIIPAVQKG